MNLTTFRGSGRIPKLERKSIVYEVLDVLSNFFVLLSAVFFFGLVIYVVGEVQDPYHYSWLMKQDPKIIGGGFFGFGVIGVTFEFLGERFRRQSQGGNKL